MSFYIYILKCSDDSYYTGHTDNLEMRIVAHQTGEIPGYSFTRRPVHLVFSEEFPTRVDAIERERQIKRWSRHKKEALIKQDWDRLKQLARSRGSTSSPRTG
ncbi:MAG: GIY-YIG nuclease family protein [Dehalococcoidia bacterium]